ncbi:MAG: DUF1963 domain-containing protein [Actinobacteria bacterium]|nr:DUF1963 domain-containing protein [Actinomycetota bacterium]
MTDPPFHDLTSLRSRLSNVCATRLSQRAATVVQALARPAVRLRHTAAPTASHLGGAAQLEPETTWPEWDGTPLSLLAVIDLTELSGFSIDITLPDEGTLNVFYDADDQCAWGMVPEDREAWRVIFVPGRGAVRRAAPPGTLEFPTIGLAPEQTLTVPGWEEPAVHSIVPPRRERPASHSEPERSSRRRGREQRDRDAYFAFLDAWIEDTDAEWAPNHQMGGWPQLQQAAIWVECDIVSRGLPLETRRQWRNSHLMGAPRNDSDWRLLLQVDTDEEAGWMWGDAGMLYYAVRESLPFPQTFEEAWMVLQCG